MSAKRTSWNEFSSTMASAMICLSTVQSPPPQQQSPPPAQPQDAHFPLSLLQEALDACTALARCVEHPEHDKVAQDLEIIKLKSRVKKMDKANKGRMTEELDKDEATKMVNEEEETKEVRVNAADTQVEGRQAEIYHIDMDHAAKVLSMQEEEEPEVQEPVEVVTISKLITEVVVAASGTVSVAAVVPTPVTAATVTPAPVKVDVPATRRKRGVVIWDPEEESSTKTPT
nr:hypothetical protein [Tanacetum cinerariifolium]